MIWQKMSPRVALKLMRFYPPYLGAGVKVADINEDFTEITVEMNLTPLNVNYVGTHFGGSLYSMCDPFFMFILLHHLKQDHIVWDKAAKIDFVRPGKGKVKAVFKIEPEEIEFIKRRALQEFKQQPVFKCEVVDEKNEVIARLEKTLYIRRKDAKKRFESPQPEVGD